jgi:citrate lyase subunit beta / citryl-CoA lyase
MTAEADLVHGTPEDAHSNVTTDAESSHGRRRQARRRRLRRSELAVPATSEKMLTKAAGSDADLVFIDLEDAVTPEEKAGARDGVIWALDTLDWTGKTRAVRVNGAHTQWCLDDVTTLVRAVGRKIDILIIPKVYAPRDVHFIDTLLTQLERGGSAEPGSIGLEVLIEETQALACVETIATSSPRLEALILGVGDLSASQGVLGGFGETDNYPGDIWHYARARMTVAARAAGIDAIDGPFPDFSDSELYREQATRALCLGAVGKWAIHPAQIPLANEIFSPTQEQIDRARQVIDAVREAEANGQGAAKLDGMMIDAATARLHETTLERAQMTRSGRP